MDPESEAIKATIGKLSDGILNNLNYHAALANSIADLFESVAHLTNTCQKSKNENVVLKSVITSLVVLAIVHFIQYAVNSQRDQKRK